MRFGTWNVRSLYRACFLTAAAAARELARNELDLVGVQEVRWDKGGTVRPRFYIFSMENKTKKSISNRTFCTPQNSVSSENGRVC